MNPLSVLGGFSLQTKALLVILVFTAGFGAGYKTSDAFSVLGEAQSINQQIKTGDKIADEGKKAAKEVQKAVVETRIVYRTIKEKIHEQNDNRICFADNDALSLWNHAIAGKDKDRSDTAGKTSEAYSVVATVEQVLANAAENFETCNINRENHNKLIDTVEALDGKMCTCAK